MKDISRFYALFEKLLDEDSLFIDPSVGFDSICRMIGAPRRKLDSYIYKELGMHGDSVIACYRAQWYASIIAKYGKSFRKNYYLCPIRPIAGKLRTETKQ
ncbi:MAG: hypothetical protein J6T02_00975 [Bacteroidales bacterium]|nr:hypothetical protein [Bacteroidales bacterium]